jgi:hypothetical protein
MVALVGEEPLPFGIIVFVLDSYWAMSWRRPTAPRR